MSVSITNPFFYTCASLCPLLICERLSQVNALTHQSLPSTSRMAVRLACWMMNWWISIYVAPSVCSLLCQILWRFSRSINIFFPCKVFYSNWDTPPGDYTMASTTYNYVLIKNCKFWNRSVDKKVREGRERYLVEYLLIFLDLTLYQVVC